MTAYWIFIIDDTNISSFRKNLIYGFNLRNRNLYDKIGESDQIILYVKPKRLDGCYQIVRKLSNSAYKFPVGDYSLQMEVKVIKKSPELFELRQANIDNISIFKGKLWGPVLMGRPAVKITQQDYIYLKNLL